MSSASIELDHVSKAYGGFQAVDDLSLSVRSGSIFGLLGPNGAGKTTSIRMMMDIIAPDSGTVRLFGEPRTQAHLERIGYLPEERGLYRKMTVFDHVVFLGRLHGMSRSDARTAATVWIERVELSDWSGKKVEELSKGMQQKIQLVGTVLHEPDVLVLDEPFSGLDPINQELFKDLLTSYQKGGRTVIFSTHIMEQAERICDEICLVYGGRPILEGRVDEIKKRYGGNSYRLVADGPIERASEVPGVTDIQVRDGYAKLILAADASGSQVLRSLIEFLEVHEFRSEQPSLEEVFIRAVKSAR